MEQWNNLMHDFIWGSWMLAAFLGVGVYYTIKSRFFQIRGFSIWMKETFGAMIHGQEEKDKEGKSITQFQSLCTALAATLGTGNIAGVATALTAGGAGAIFWMWMSAFLGMMTNFAEKTLGIIYRYRGEDGEWMGGPMVYMERGLHSKLLAILFSVLCILASFGMGNMAQAHSVAEAVRVSFGGKPLIIGIVTSILLACVILGGIGRIASVTEKLIPFMAIGYIGGGILVLVLFWKQIPSAFQMILHSAFTKEAAGGGILGYGVKKAMTVGISRGIFSNEAGLGSSVIVHAASEVKEPVRQGLWGIQEVFIDTVVMCTLTALIILVTGAMDTGQDGIALTNTAFTIAFGKIGGIFVSTAVILFGFATLIGWSYYGVKCVEYLFGKRWVSLYQGIYCGMAVIGCTMELTTVWNLADNLNGLMAVPNLIALILLAPRVTKEMKQSPLLRKKKE